MRRRLALGLALAAGLLVASNGQAQTEQAQPPGPAKQATVGPNFVDNDGDGVCDRCASGQANPSRRGRGGRGGYGPGDGTGNQGVGPQDGSGYGPGPGANCDGTGPKGRGRRAGRR
jgi:hypothetical protein